MVLKVIKIIRNVFLGAAVYKTNTTVLIWHPRGKIFVWKELKYNGSVFYEYKIGPFVLWKKLK